MSAELEKSSYSSALLDESSSAMQGISTEYTSFGDMLRNSGTLIRSMERADLIDAAILAGAALFFVLCIAYILKVRVWDRGVGILSFFWRFISLGRSPGDVKEKYQLAQDAASAAKASAKESSISASKSLAAAAAATAKDVASSASASLAASKSMAAAAASTAKDAATSATASLASSAKAASESASASLSSAAEAATPAVTRVTDVLKAAASTAAAVAAAFDMGGEDAEEIAEAQEDLSGGMAEGTWGVITDDDEDTEEKDREERLKESAKHIEL
jgi:protein transport protein SEC20